MTYYRRRDLTESERWLAGVISVAVGTIAFYLARVWLQREPMEEAPPEPGGVTRPSP